MKKSILIKIVILINFLIYAMGSAYANGLIFATEATYPPFAFIQPNGKMAGFDADMINALCQQMHSPCHLINAPWDSLIPSLQVGKYDALFGGMAITEQRKKVVNFTNPYYKNTVTFVVNKNFPIPLSKNDLKNKAIGVQSGTTFQNYLQAQYGDSVTIKTYASNMTALMDLKQNKIDAVFLDQPVARLWLQQSGNGNYKTEGSINNSTYFGIGNGIAVQKGNIKLVQALNDALNILKKNGQYQKILNKWFA